MLTIINGTNRPQNLSKIFSTYCLHRLQESYPSLPISFLTLESLPPNFMEENMYGKKTEAYAKLINDHITSADKFLFVAPEYNGSYAGVLKVFIDSIPPVNFRGKKAAVLGVADGRAGNLLGIDHLITTLNHIGVNTMPQRQPLGSIGKLINEQELVDEATKETINRYLDLLVNF